MPSRRYRRVTSRPADIGAGLFPYTGDSFGWSTVRAVGEQKAQRNRKAQHPLTYWLPGQNLIDRRIHMLFVLARMTSGLYGNAEDLQVWQHIVASPLFHLELWLGL